MGKIIDEILGLVYPDNIKCLVCDDELTRDTKYSICDACALLRNSDYCVTCGRRIVGMGNYCDDCMESKPHFDRARSAFLYDGEVKDMVRRLKYGNAGYLAKYMAEFIADVYYENDFDVDVITFVPMHISRENKRGYNQAFLIAECLGKVLNLPVEQLLKRTSLTENLARLNRRDRKDAIASSLALNDNARVHDRRILLVDDVITTCSTTSECSRVLKNGKMGAKSVEVVAFASSFYRKTLY